MSSLEDEILNLRDAMISLAETFTSQGYDLLTIGPYRAFLWTRHVSFFRRARGLAVDLDHRDWERLSDQFDKGNYTLGNVFGYARGNHKFFIVVAADSQKKLAFMYSLYLHDEVYNQIKRYRPLLIAFKNTKTNKSFVSFLNDPSWNKKVESPEFPRERFLVDASRREKVKRKGKSTRKA